MLRVTGQRCRSRAKVGYRAREVSGKRKVEVR
jgi:hypothetical protein